MTTATERYKMLLANALERVCVLEAELEQRDEREAADAARIAELEQTLATIHDRYPEIRALEALADDQEGPT